MNQECPRCKKDINHFLRVVRRSEIWKELPLDMVYYIFRLCFIECLHGAHWLSSTKKQRLKLLYNENPAGAIREFD